MSRFAPHSPAVPEYYIGRIGGLCRENEKDSGKPLSGIHIKIKGTIVSSILFLLRTLLSSSHLFIDFMLRLGIMVYI